MLSRLQRVEIIEQMTDEEFVALCRRVGSLLGDTEEQSVDSILLLGGELLDTLSEEERPGTCLLL